MTILCSVEGHDWFEFKAWDGYCWVPARQCRRYGCGMEAFHNGRDWVGRNLRYLKAKQP